jgi:alpha-1,3-rhamnosyl/mannosyltransferase
VTVHDAIAERFPQLTLPSQRARWFWRGKVKLAIWQARLVLTVSDYSARELVARLGVARDRLRVAIEAPAAAYRPSESDAAISAAAARIGLPKDSKWFVYVGGFNPHKRVDLLVRAHATLVAEHGTSAPYLVLVGAAERDGFHQDLDSIRKAISAAGTERFVLWAGFLPDEELRHIHSGALALVLPSESEGFGLPAVEAAACGTAVVATVESPLPTLLAGGGIFVRPGDEGVLTDALRQIVSDEPARRVMGARARERASELTWPRSARAVLAALREAGNGVRPAPVVRGQRPLQHVEIAG